MRRSKKRNCAAPVESHGGKGIDACQQNRQIRELLETILKCLQMQKGNCVIQNQVTTPGGGVSDGDKTEQFMKLETDIQDVRLSIGELLSIVEALSKDRLGEGFLKDFVRIMGLVRNLPAKPKTKTHQEILVLAEEMEGVLLDHEFTPIVPQKGDAFDPNQHVPIEVRGEANAVEMRQIETLFRPGVKKSNGQVVLHARVGLSVKDKSCRKEKIK